jgi:4-amino-4-deoxy-L-arabinose transferase-like glycosyltransferase
MKAFVSLVAFEMKMSGNFIVPTMNGEFYYNKPPLYNWFIYGMSMLLGHFGEWPSRLTTLISLGGTCMVCLSLRQ